MKTYQQFMEKLIMNYRPQSGAGGANARKSREHQLKATAKHDERLKLRKAKEQQAKTKTDSAEAK